MSELQFGDPPINGVQAKIIPGPNAALPHRVVVTVRGDELPPRDFPTREDAENYQREAVHAHRP